jgi:hypothetical protein
MHNTKTLATLFVALLLGLVSQDVAAQGNIAMGYTITVKDGMNDGFEAAVKQHMTWRKEHGDPWQWDTYLVVVGENLGLYGFRSGNHNWSDFDAYYVWEEESGANAHFEATVAPYIESVSNALAEMDTDLTRMPEDGGPYNLFAVTTFHLNSGMAPAFESAITAARAAMDEHDYPMDFIISWPGLGNSGPSVSFITPHENWADFAPPEEEIGAFLTRTLGAEEAGKIFQQFTGSFHSSDSFVAWLRRDLSSPTEAAGTQ